MFNSARQNIILNIKNIPGWRTNRRIVVIECDDWGGIRMPSKAVYEILSAKGLITGKKRYNRYDTLETAGDLQMLFEVLDGVKDKNRRPAVMTAVANVANPDFEKIRKGGFAEYHYEKFTDTLKRYYPADDVFGLWKEGIKTGIFMPELHGREHISVQLWMQKLRDGDKDLLYAFDNSFVFFYTTGLPAPVREFRPGFYFTSESEKPFLSKSITESASLFHEIFGFAPKVFVPGNGIFHPDFDIVVADSGMKFLYVSKRMPYPVEGGGLKYRHFTTGQKGPGGITYYTRNCVFEPTDDGYKGIDLTMRQIKASFRWGKPAVISTHRVNFAGGIDPSNRARGLAELKKLLNAITTRWPDTEFLSAAEALEHMRSTN